MTAKFKLSMYKEKTERETEISHMVFLLSDDYSEKPKIKEALHKSLIMLLYSHWEWLINNITENFIKSIYEHQSLSKIPKKLLKYSLKNNFFWTDKVGSEKAINNVINFIKNTNQSLTIFVDTKDNLWYDVFFELINNTLSSKERNFIDNIKKNILCFTNMNNEEVKEKLKFFLNDTLLNFRNTFSHGNTMSSYNQEKIIHWLWLFRENKNLFPKLYWYLLSEKIYIGKNKKIEKILNEIIFKKEFIEDCKDILFKIINSYIDILGQEYDEILN